MFLVACVGRIMEAQHTKKGSARRIRDAPQRHLQPYAQIPGTHPARSNHLPSLILLAIIILSLIRSPLSQERAYR